MKRRGRDAFAYKREFTGTATPKRAIFIIIPIRSSRCTYYKFPPVIFFSFFFTLPLPLPRRKTRPPDAAPAAPVFIGSPARSPLKLRDDSAVIKFQRGLPIFFESWPSVRAFRRRHSRLNGSAKHFLFTIETSRLIQRD